MKRILSLAIALVYWSTRRVWRWTLSLFGAVPARPAVVLTYHSVPGDQLDRFEQQMLLVKAHAEAVFADEISASDGRPRVAVTFDDAFQSVFDGALRVLARHRIPATVFVPTGYLGGEPGWQVTPGTGNRPSGTVVSRGCLAELDRELIRLGSHTVSHPRLSTIPRTAVMTEFTASKRVLEEITGRPVRSCSLPYGAFNHQVLESAASAGYEHVFANVPVPVGVERSSGLKGRINTSPRDWPIEFRLKTSGAYQWLCLAIPVKGAVMKRLRISQQHA